MDSRTLSDVRYAVKGLWTSTISRLVEWVEAVGVTPSKTSKPSADPATQNTATKKNTKSSSSKPTRMSLELFDKYGDPNSAAFKKRLVLWDVPSDIEIGVIPKKIYCHPDIIVPLEKAFRALIAAGKVTDKNGKISELKTWDGCYNVRPIRGQEKKYNALILEGHPREACKFLSKHSWGLAVDVNAFENGLGQEPKLSKAFVKCFTDQGFRWGGDFKRKDGMHFELG